MLLKAKRYNPKQRKERYYSNKQAKKSKPLETEIDINMSKNMKDFQKSMKFTMTQCQTCFESWPIKNISKVDDYCCARCKRVKGTPKKFSAENNMKPSAVPEALKGLDSIVAV